MKSPIDLLSALLDDLGSICSVETTRDLETIKSRVEHEGESFLTLTLPDFATAFERSLELGQVDQSSFYGWKMKQGKPLFLRGFLDLVFGAEGEVKPDACSSAIYSVRQVCRTFKKVRIPCSKEKEARAFAKFEELEQTLHEAIVDTDSIRMQHFAAVCDIIWSTCLGSEEFNPLDLVPKHGPGATAEKVGGNAKYSHLKWHDRLEDEGFHFTEYLFASLNQLDCNAHGIHKVELRSADQELPVRIIGVPKTLKAPRIIAIEPVCMQYVQQAIASWVIKRIETCTLTKDSIRFTDQTRNQIEAMKSSLTRESATVDLSDASDRVTLQMVRLMLRSQPRLLGAIEACRSRTAKMPNGNIVHLAKFASMGSALCFPIEAMYFFSILVHNSLWSRDLPPQFRHVRRACREFHVYGDDLVIPAAQTESAFEALAHFGCKVNTTKSFLYGYFRESCGCDAYRGIDVTPIYVREVAPQSRRDSVGLLSWISTSNQFHMAGCWKTARHMQQVVERILGKLPVVSERSSGLGWNSFCGLQTPSLCMSWRFHAPMVHTYRVRAKKEKDPLTGYPALLKYFLRSGRDENAEPSPIDKKHLRYSARCGYVSRKRHWVLA